VLEQFPTTPIILEIKEPRATPAVKRVLDEHDARRRVLVGGFDHSAVAPFGAGWLRAASRREVAFFWAAARLGARRWAGAYSAFTVPEYQGRLRVVEERFAGLARRVGKPVHVWTVNDPGQGQRLRAIGVCGLITNFPQRLHLDG
jgi:glycerophosphoryl diester phosphodiesterase